MQISQFSRACLSMHEDYANCELMGPGRAAGGSAEPTLKRLWLPANGHEWARRQLAMAGVGFAEWDNGLWRVEDPEAVDRICASLSAGHVGDLIARWLPELPSPLTAADRAAGFDSALSIRQMEISDTAVFDRPRVGRAWFEAAIGDHLDLGRPDKVRLKAKGRALEELTTRLFNTILGFQATGNLRTETEEIDIRIQNTSDDPRWRQETYLLLGECKNWSGKCGKDEFVVFKNKLRNRVGRVSCGVLISWNGFTETVTKEMLRGSEGNLLVVPVDGAQLRAAVRESDFAARLKALHEEAVFL